MTSYTHIALYALAVIVVTLVVCIRVKRRLRPPPPPLPMSPIVDETVWLLQLDPMDWTVHNPDALEHEAKGIKVTRQWNGPIDVDWAEGSLRVYEGERRRGWEELTEAMEAMRVSRFRNLVTEDL